MAEPRAKRFEHDVELHRDRRFGADGEMVEVPENWTPEDSVLAGLLEILQMWAPGRRARLEDFLVDAATACIGLAIAAVIGGFAARSRGSRSQ